MEYNSFSEFKKALSIFKIKNNVNFLIKKDSEFFIIEAFENKQITQFKLHINKLIEAPTFKEFTNYFTLLVFLHEAEKKLLNFLTSVEN